MNLGKPSVNVTGTAVASKPASGVSGTVRVFRTLYLDEFFRVAQFEPEDETREPVLFVFQRLSEEEEEEVLNHRPGNPKFEFWDSSKFCTRGKFKIMCFGLIC